MKKIVMLMAAVVTMSSTHQAFADHEVPVDQLKWDQATLEGRSDFEQYFENYCRSHETADSRTCFKIDEESAIMDALKSTGQDIHLVVTGKRAVLLNEKEYYAFQGIMADHLAKAGEGVLKLIASPHMDDQRSSLILKF